MYLNEIARIIMNRSRLDIEVLSTPVFAGLFGPQLSVDNYDLGDGYILKKEQACLIRPFVIALDKDMSGAYDLSKSKSVYGTAGIDINLQLTIPIDGPTSKASAQHAYWLIASLRLATRSIFCPILSVIEFSHLKKAHETPPIVPLENPPAFLDMQRVGDDVINIKDLEWVKNNWRTAKRLADQNSNFYDAFVLFESSLFCNDMGSATLTIWSALERLFSLSFEDQSPNLSFTMAHYLAPNDANARHIYEKIMKLYAARHMVVDGHGFGETDIMVDTIELSFRVFSKIIESGQMPVKRQAARISIEIPIPDNDEETWRKFREASNDFTDTEHRPV